MRVFVALCSFPTLCCLWRGDYVNLRGCWRQAIARSLAICPFLRTSYTDAQTPEHLQAGDRVRAIKCLVRSGDTKAVIQFASISRNVEIYKLAANYLQQMNWRESVDILKAIITFYTKAKVRMS
jgi:intraflagellar transport protein 140